MAIYNQGKLAGIVGYKQLYPNGAMYTLNELLTGLPRIWAIMLVSVNNNLKRYHIIIKKWTTATCKNIKMLERGKGYFPFSRFLFR